MTATHKETIPLRILDGSDGLFLAEFTYSPGMDACGPAYDHGGLPAEPAEIEIVAAWYCDDNGIPMMEAALCLGQHEREIAELHLLENWEPPSGPDPDDERDRRRDEELESRP